MNVYEIQPAAGFEVLTRTTRPTPTVGATAVRVRVRAVSLNFRDLAILRSASHLKAPVIPASDGAGEVVEVGAAVTRLAVGDRVAASFFPTWLDGELTADAHRHALGGTIDGMLAEEVVLDQASWVPLPQHLSYEEAATLPCAGVTAYNALFEGRKIGPADTVLLLGTGGVSIFALQLAKSAGARVVLTTSSAEKGARATTLGADHIIDYVATPEWGAAAREWAGGGVDLVVEVGGSGTLNQSVDAARFGGSISLIGVLTGVKSEIHLRPIFYKALTIRGIYVGPVRMFEALNKALTVTGIRPIIDTVFLFDEVRAAYEYLASAAHFGKVVIRLP
jgi:NADPH:quinone reductase-like Zn-dependent oxidoreductase